MRNLILVDLREGMPALTFAAGERLAEAASRILDVVGQGMSMTLDVTGDHIESFRLERLPVDGYHSSYL